MNIKRARRREDRSGLAVVGYFSRRDGEAICLRHGEPGPAYAWIEIRFGDRWEAENGETGPVRCHRCGEWLESPPESQPACDAGEHGTTG